MSLADSDHQLGFPADPDRADCGRIERFAAQDGLMLAARIFGETSEALSIVCLPGLSRNSKDFAELGRVLSSVGNDRRKVIALDYRGRGRSDWDRDWRNYTIEQEAQDVLAATSALGIADAVFIGTSRGGLIIMALGALRPAMMAGIVLNDIGPVIEGTGLARIKHYLTGAQSVSGWSAAVAAVRKIHEPNFPALTDQDWERFAWATYFEDGDAVRPDFDPKLMKTIADVDFGAALPQLWPQFSGLRDIPLFSIRGENSDILSSETVSEMAQQHTNLERLAVSGQGHAPVLSDEASLTRIAAFVQRCDRDTKLTRGC